MELCIGEVIAVKGIKIIIKVYEQSNLETIFYKGQTYQGISINEHLCIQRGFKDIIAKVEGEYLDESRAETENHTVSYIRKVELQPLGHFEGESFFEGVKHLPMIGDRVFLLNKEKIYQIYSQGNGDFSIGQTIKDSIRISLPWQHLFNTHIGVFGNTGSGKSNTLTKLYTELFNGDVKRTEAINKHSKFIVIDFNGEYTGKQLVSSENKNVIKLNTRTSGGGKVSLSESSFWSAEVLGLLFKATENTQKPFINRVVSGFVRFGDSVETLERYLNSTFFSMFASTSQARESIDLLRALGSMLDNESDVSGKLNQVTWYAKGSVFRLGNVYFNGGEDDFNKVFCDFKLSIKKDIDTFERFKIRCHLQLINDLLHGFVQFDFIQPLLKRMDAVIYDLSKVINVQSSENTVQQNNKLLTVISLRQCNQEIKKIIPLLLTLNYYEAHKKSVQEQSNIDRTLHLIIDEAHNILSQQSNREAESWKDYRLELFEEIIKEGRKFGVFLTLSSQRPADISPTIMSQIHNFFIHRLVNDKDLFLIDNTISSLDAFSKNMIPKLAKGCCVVTGTTFDLPLLIQVDKMLDGQRPDSDDIDLEKLWGATHD
ncbi:ATP-binding protein [Marinospirillum insulare]|uniref:Helicase HerA central domain-containing protein n=1 Tax=Marinospirillum insulare TaxID=217169 RepID=A0ABQ5ZW28_9GAMM|nr:ATP-binding protein [Marinospirillum insulare]GLR63210.1 hypothetical protein GCM10007878_06450 [Marinospirillum insulare]